MSPASLAVLLGLCTSVAWAAANVYVQRASLAFGSLRAMFWGQLAGSLVLVPASLAVEGWPAEAPPWLGLLVGGLGSVAGYYGMMRAFAGAPLGAVVPIVASWPVPALVWGLLRGEDPSQLQRLGAALVVAGSVANGALSRGGEWRAPRAPTFAFALLGCLGFGLMVVGVGEVQPALGAIGTVPAVWAAQWVLLLPALVLQPAILQPPRAWRDLLAMSGYESVGFVLYAVAVGIAGLAVASPPASLSAVFTVAFAVAFLKERLSLLQAACVLTAALGCVLLAG